MVPCWKPGRALNSCARALFRQHAEQVLHLPGPWWSGWVIRQHRLIAPEGRVWTPHTISAAAYWQDWGLHPEHQHQGPTASLGTVCGVGPKDPHARCASKYPAGCQDA